MAGRSTRLGVLTGSLLALVLLVHTGIARASFVVSTCDGKTPAPWQNGYDGLTGPGSMGAFAGFGDTCSVAGGGTNFFQMVSAKGSALGAGFSLPADERLTHLSATWTSQDTRPSGQAEMAIIVAPGAPGVFEGGLGGTGSVNADVASGSGVLLEVACAFGDPCKWYNGPVVTMHSLDLTIRDTGAPAVSATGGGLSHSHRVGGVQTLLYHASDVGSGVARVTVALGPHVVASAAMPCDFSSLTPCPANVTNTIDVDTTRVKNGSYPVILTAYDASGDPDPVQVATARVKNTGTVKLRPTGKLHAHLTLAWRWTLKRSTLTGIRASHLPARARVALTCKGKGCPFRTRWATRGKLKRLAHHSFRPGDTLTIRISARGDKPERARLKIRRGKVPARP